MITYLWIVFVVSTSFVGLAAVTTFWSVTWPGAAQAQLAMIFMVPIWLAAWLLCFVGGVSGVLLSVHLDQTSAQATTGVLGGVMLILAIAPIWAVVWHLHHRKAATR